MTEIKNKSAKKRLEKGLYIFAYLFVLGLYGVIGGLLLSLVFQSLPVALLIIVAIFIGAKLDYRFKGLASKFEQKYVSRMEN
ncbi:MAG: hypothetical protein WBK55_04555 [Alphaproteobacteria bacterium]